MKLLHHAFRVRSRWAGFRRELLRRTGRAPLFILGVMLSFLLAACAAPPEVDVPITWSPSETPQVTVVVPTPEPPPPKTLVICLPNEPESLYIYGAASHASDVVLEALYDGPFDLLGYQEVPVILEKIPSLADGDARIEQISVSDGEVYFNPESLQAENLALGKPYLPSGCESQDCVQTYGGGSVLMDRVVADFRILPEVRWSDGEPVLASDSVFSFLMDAHVDSPTTKYMVDLTAGYSALDERTVEWIGIPGFMDAEFGTNFWTPLPEHQLGDLDAAALLEAEQSTKRPLGWGPYVLVSWTEGESIVFSRNPDYFRAAEGLPAFEFLMFRFLGETEPRQALAQVLSGECDVLDENLLPYEVWSDVRDLVESGSLTATWAPGPLVTRVEFNLQDGAPALRDAGARQGLAACVDREGLIQEVLYGFGAPAGSYLPGDHPLYRGVIAESDDGPLAGAAALEAAGWRDGDGDPLTPRVAQGVQGVEDGTELSFTLLVSRDPMARAVAQSLQADFASCGAQVQIETRLAQDLLAPWPEGQVFGGSFDAVLWSWPTLLSPPCENFAGWEVPDEDRPLGVNGSRMADRAYDRACRAAFLARPGSETYQRAAEEAQARLAELMPFIPLYARARLVVSRNDVCGLQIDPSAATVFWNLEVLDAGEACGEN